MCTGKFLTARGAIWTTAAEAESWSWAATRALSTNGSWRGSYDVPGRANAIIGYTYYGEAKYTFTPRFFAAARVERNKYPFIRPFGATWVARTTDFVDGELGVGYRVTATTLIKMSVRADRRWVAPGVTVLGRGGPAFAMQASQSFDVLELFSRPK